ncbi:MAG: 30S ribosomal protein S12 methylthiotransferase RimO [Armatimonadetes bacterium]|nr:30S ribosomal protein S12 methylthiotransferase RimO [Armatimonadota bacterium]
MAKVSLISLGCPKNLVDSEGALGEVTRAGHELITDSSLADVIIINTCGFIESARAESVEAVGQAVKLKKSGTCKAVIAIGCLAQRFAAEMAEAAPEVDAFLGIGHAGLLAETIESALGGKTTVGGLELPTKWDEHGPRVQSTPPWTSYLKIADGCDNRCAYCAIPDIRGRFRSRPKEYIIDEAKRLADAGVKEIVLIGQDLTQYGEDLGMSNALVGLLVRLNDIEGLRWIRPMYCYPAKVTPELIDIIATGERIVKYIDLPLQHGDNDVLNAMHRKGNVEQYEQVISDLRAKRPEIAIRSTFIVGFPGETPAAFHNLLGFVRRIKLDRVGVFTYSIEEGTPAAKLKNRVSAKTAEVRLDKLMRLQQGISLERNKAFIGKNLEALIESTTDGVAIGRTYRDAPEIDGIVQIKDCAAKPGAFVNVKITGADEYDLVGVTQ